MLKSLDFNSFGLKLQDLRVQLGMTQRNVANTSGINVDTLRRIENGYSIPRIDTLIILSQVYKTDLLEMLTQYFNITVIDSFYLKVEELLQSTKEVDYPAIGQELIDSIDADEELLQFLQRDIRQFKLFTEAIAFRESNNNRNLELAREKIIMALRCTLQAFEVARFNDYRYSIFEMRLLQYLATILADCRDYETSIQITQFCLKCYLTGMVSTKEETVLIAKCYAQLSHSHYRQSAYDISYNFASKGIRYCLKKNIHLQLTYLLFRKGAAEFAMFQSGHQLALTKSFGNTLSLLEIQENFDAYENYKRVINEKLSS